MAEANGPSSDVASKTVGEAASPHKDEPPQPSLHDAYAGAIGAAQSISAREDEPSLLASVSPRCTWMSCGKPKSDAIHDHNQPTHHTFMGLGMSTDEQASIANQSIKSVSCDRSGTLKSVEDDPSREEFMSEPNREHQLADRAWPEEALSDASKLSEWQWWFAHTSDERKQMVKLLFDMYSTVKRVENKPSREDFERAFRISATDRHPDGVYFTNRAQSAWEGYKLGWQARLSTQAIPEPSLVEKLRAKWNEIDGAAQTYSLDPCSDRHKRFALDMQRAGAMDMWRIVEEFAQKSAKVSPEVIETAEIA